jgi:chemotaxis protein MotB
VLWAARAATVARLFAEHGVDPARLGIIGWGQVRPLADNTTPEGRNLNRRVLVVVLSDRTAPSRFYTDPHPLDADPLVAMDEAAIPRALPTARVTAADETTPADGEVSAAPAAGPTLRQAADSAVAAEPSAGRVTAPAGPAAREVTMPAAGVLVPTANAAPMGGAPRRNPPAAPLQ